LIGLAACAVSLGLSGCDQGSADVEPAHGPALHVVATYPADGQGVNTALDAGVGCDSPAPDCAVPTNVQLEVRFDRFLLPGAGLASGLRLFSGDPKANAVSLKAQYDLIERVVVFTLNAPLRPNTIYTAKITPGKDISHGFWAFDGAPLEEGSVPLTFSFSTGSGPVDQGTPEPLPSDDCVSLTERASAGANAAPSGPLYQCIGCHTDPPREPASDPNAYPPMGLSLSAWGLEHTAINVVAHETETGSSALGPGRLSGPRFGVEMGIVTPGHPENSYLMYKLLRKPENFRALGDCDAGFHPPVADGACAPPDDAELARLREWFVLGDPMPLASSPGSPASLSREDLLRIRGWIRDRGAACDVP
jgi:hypothetical protein